MSETASVLSRPAIERLNRDTVVDLLLNGDVRAARRLAAAVTPALGETIAIHVIVGPAAGSRPVLDALREHSGGSAWIGRRYGDDEHTIVLEPCPPGQPGGGPLHEAAVGAMRSVCRTSAVGSSGRVPLARADEGYASALRAAYAAREGGWPHGFGLPDDTSAAGALPRDPTVRRWAAHLLAPLATYTPKRASDPDARELTDTLRAWLTAPHKAARNQFIHRNTLARRLDTLQDMLGCELSALADRAQLSLALHVHKNADPGRNQAADACPPDLDTLVRGPAARRWARHRLRPLRDSGTPVDLTTLRMWFAHDIRSVPTAAALGISVTALRKRVARVELALGHRVFNHPAAHHDLWLAMLVHDRCALSAVPPMSPTTEAVGGAVRPRLIEPLW